MPVSVWLVRVSNGSEEKLINAIDLIPGAEVTESGNACLVVATDTEKPKDEIEIIDKIKNLDHVTEVSLVMTANEDAVNA